MMLDVLVMAACLAGGSAPLPDGPAPAVYIDCSEPLEIVGTAKPEPEPPAPVRVYLGIDCNKPVTISLPDNVLTECETE